MKQTHFGWSKAEDQLLLQAVRNARENGASLQNAFAAVAEKTNRKPNSVRNRYYAVLKSTGTLPPPFVPFTESESDELIRSVLLAKSKGESVRSCTLSLAEGDMRRMLRYQNKYRALLRSAPERVNAIRKDLLDKGIQVPDVYAAHNGTVRAGRPTKAALPIAAIRKLLDALYEDIVALSNGAAS